MGTRLGRRVIEAIADHEDAVPGGLDRLMTSSTIDGTRSIASSIRSAETGTPATS